MGDTSDESDNDPKWSVTHDGILIDEDQQHILIQGNLISVPLMTISFVVSKLEDSSCGNAYIFERVDVKVGRMLGFLTKVFPKLSLTYNIISPFLVINKHQ